MSGKSSAKTATYTTVSNDADAELAAARERAARQRIVDDVAAIVARMDAAADEALTVWIHSDDTEDDESIHALGSLMRLMHLRGVWARGREDLRGCIYRGETPGPEPVRPPIFDVVDELEARRIAYR